MTIAESLALGLHYHRSGQLDEAEALYRQILTEDPFNADTLHLLGLLVHQKGSSDQALALIAAAIRCNPQVAVYQSNYGNVLKRLGRVDEAVAAYRQALSLDASLADAYVNLGNVLQDQGKLEEAADAYRDAIRVNCGRAEAHYNLGAVLKRMGKIEQAEQAYRDAVRLEPSWAEAHNNLGNVLMVAGKFDEAAAAFRDAIQWRPGYAEAHGNLGNALHKRGELDAAIAAFRMALALNPALSEIHYNLGNVFKEQRSFEDALQAYETALLGRPDMAEIHANMGHVLHDLGRFEEALLTYRTAIRLKPALPDAHWNMALTMLLLGDFEQGWPEYEWRTRIPIFSSLPAKTPAPMWDGSPLERKRILIFDEQGWGDIFQFIRYVPLVTARGGRVVLRMPPEVARLVRNVHGVEACVADESSLDDVQACCRLLSLPGIFKTTLETIPATAPYLFPEESLVQRWKERVPADGRLKIGLVWAGREVPDPRRSMPIEALGPLANFADVWFCSLQKGAAANQISRAPEGLVLTDWTGELRDFADTAALIANLDLIITVDTAVAHLAGALGKPVWVLLMAIPDWRWLLGCSDSPWYPTMRLFRQSWRDDWQEPMTEISVALRDLLGRRSGSC